MSDIDALVSRWVRPQIRTISAYHIPDSTGLIKLDAMENPYPWPDEMVAEWQELLAATPVNRYPDPSASRLTQSIRRVMDIPDEMGVILGNGSDELIQILAQTLAEPGRTIMAPTPSFVMYQMIATFVGMGFTGVPLREDFSLDLEAMICAIKKEQPALIFLAYPNNPTGNLFVDSDIEAILEVAEGVVVVDEAYHAFAGKSWMGRLGDYPNLLVMRTLSKLGLAGLRLGLLAGPTAWIEQLDKVRLPYNINTLTQVTAEFALAHIEIFNGQTHLIREERESLMQQLLEIEGVTPYPSAANFILFRVGRGLSTTIFNGIKGRGVLIKNMGQIEGPLADCLRVTVSSGEENGHFVRALQDVLRETLLES
ncbi:MAG: histidinol-phosphate transaminase [Gammaproteobacteria bacterium]|nr:histidinol-phosphate transaminase [Gammaproteobacteria bacterium]